MLVSFSLESFSGVIGAVIGFVQKKCYSFVKLFVSMRKVRLFDSKSMSQNQTLHMGSYCLMRDKRNRQDKLFEVCRF